MVNFTFGYENIKKQELILMGQTESVFGIGREHWPNVLISSILPTFVLTTAYIPIWRRYWVMDEYKEEKTLSRWLLLNPRIWYNGIVWWGLLLFGAGIGIYRMLRVLQQSKDGEVFKIYNAEVALLVSTLQLGIHGLWGIPWFYWKQAFWSICIMGLSTIVAAIAYVFMLQVDEVATGIAYGIYIGAQAIFTIANIIILYYCYDDKKDSPKNPIYLYCVQGMYPIRKKKRRRRKEKRPL